MLMFTYLLLLPEQMETIINCCTSDVGKQILSEALDTAIVVKDYIDNKSTVFISKLNNNKVWDIAYSYFIYKKTGKTGKHVYAPPENEYNRFNEPNENKDGEYTYSRKDIFNSKSIYDVMMDKSIDFPVESEFNIFVKEWIANDDSITTISTINTLGYNKTTGAFGYFNKISSNEIGNNTIKLAKAIFNRAEKLSPDGKNTIIDFIIDNLTSILVRSAKTSIIFNTSYNQLNRNVDEKNKTYKSAQFFNRLNLILSNIDKTNGSAVVQNNRVVSDCSVIFDAIKNNSANVKSFISLSDLMDNLPKELEDNPKVCRENVELSNFLLHLCNKFEKPISMQKSIYSIILLYVTLCDINLEYINLLLGLSLTEVELMEAGKELYDYFTIPFYYADVITDLYETLHNTFGISEEEYKINPPSEDLLNFAYVVARSSYSRIQRLNMMSRLEG